MITAEMMEQWMGQPHSLKLGVVPTQHTYDVTKCLLSKYGLAHLYIRLPICLGVICVTQAGDIDLWTSL